MLEAAPFSWLESPGWLVLSGSADPLSEIRAQALSRYNTVDAIAYISLAHDMGDALMDDMAELGAPTGYLVDLEDADNNEIHERLNTAGMIVVESNGSAERLMRLMTQTVTHAMKTALDYGALILFEGAAAAIVGEHMLKSNGELAAGMKFVQNVLVAPDISSFNEQADLSNARHMLPDLACIGLPPGAALALGPDQRIETWGEREVTISLGDPARGFYRDKAAK